MIVKTKSGHYDGDLCCGECGARAPWQPTDKDPCGDDWWCAKCRRWSEPQLCGKHPLKWVSKDKATGEVTLVPACGRY